MTSSILPPTTPTPPATVNDKARRGEGIAWWVTFGVLTFALVAMISLWN